MLKPKFYCLMGLPGAGKSTYIKESLDLRGLPVVSTDNEVKKIAEDRGKTYDEVFKEVIEEAEKTFNTQVQTLVQSKKSFIWDQTNLSKRKRLKILRTVPGCYQRILIYVNPGIFESQKRLEKRNKMNTEKTIDRDVFGFMLQTLENPSTNEGWDEIIKINF